MITDGCIPIRTVNIGPYLSASAPKVRISGSLPEVSCRRWPISGHAPGTTGGNGGFDEFLLLFLPRHKVQSNAKMNIPAMAKELETRNSIIDGIEAGAGGYNRMASLTAAWSLKVLPAQLGGRSARSLSLVEKQSLAVSQLLMTTDGCIPIRTVNIGPYLSAIAPKLRNSDSLPEVSCRKWPITGHAPGTTGGNGFDEIPFFLILLLRHEV
nr:dynein assembly factor with WDR repeat domains 1 [Ipomoea trifida]